MSVLRSDTRRARWLAIGGSLLIGATIWEVAGQLSNPSFMAPLLGSEILAPWIGTAGHPGTLPRLYVFIGQGEFLGSLASSLVLFATGFAIALIMAIPFGLILARLALLRVALEDYILVLYVTPMVAMIPFILAIIGFDFWPKVLVVTLFAFFPILYNTLEGARSVKPELIEVAKSFRTSERALWRDVLIPYTLPYALTGIRQATGRALVGMIAAEFFLSTSGLGEEIMVSSRNFDMAGVLATIIVITVLGVGLMRIVQACEARFAVWRGLDR
jgi:ABC-type nitrate/sulfonate/bicarbonate transport system permease component